MASIFKNSKIKENLERFEVPDLKDKIKLVKEWYDYYHKGTLKQEKEISVAPRYSQFLIDLLGYKGKPADGYTLESEPTTEDKGGQRPDLLLGYLSGEDRNISAVVELKGAGIALDRPQQREGNMSPIQQAFKYKTQYSSCPFVIASNFYEIRLFQDNQLDYEIWNLDDLVNPEDNYFQFRKFYYLLCADNFVAKGGKSKTEELLSDIRVEAESISKKFYKEYHELRTNLLRSLYKENESVRSNIDFGIEKAQKIVDRVVFVCFCEDTGLLPEHTLKRVLEKSKDSFGSLWNNLQGFFEEIDSGSEKLEIPKGYNGGLFAQDTDLMALKVKDDVLSKLLDLGKYDFSEDLTVNILGHIFEQSISDLEEIKQKVQKDTTVKSKRKKDGIFYTPDYIVDYIVKNSLGKYLEEKEEQLKNEYKLKGDISDKTYAKREREAYEKYQKFLQEVRVLDPACGSGAFLVKVFDYLLAENQRVGAILGNLFGTDAYNKHILKNNIYGVDLNQESVEITKLSLWLKTAQKNKKLTALDDNIKCGNSLIDDPAVAGDKAFNWNAEFKEIMDQGGFDVIVGNPPYVNIANIPNKIERQYYQNNYKTVKNKSDLYSIFLEKATYLLKPNGLLNFIFSNSWLGTDSFSEFRKFLVEEKSVLSLVKLPPGVFEDAVVTAVIILLCNSIPKGNHKVNLFEYNVNKIEKMKHSLSYERIKSTINYTFSFEPAICFKTETVKLGDIVEFSLGIKTSDDKRFILDYRKDENCYPVLRGKDIFRYYVGKPKKYIWYQPKLMMEKVGAGPRCLEDFLKPKIFVQDVAQKIIACFDEHKYLSTDTLSLVYNVDKKFNLKYILALLNSHFVNKWFKNNFPEGLHIKINQLKQIPIPNIPTEQQEVFAFRSDLITNASEELQNKLSKFSSRLQSSFNLAKISNKLENFYELDFVDFIKELKKQKVEISLKDQDEWEDYFNQYKKEILDLKSQIDKTDKEIDQMVYALYNLTDKEIGVVEGGY